MAQLVLNLSNFVPLTVLEMHLLKNFKMNQIDELYILLEETINLNFTGQLN